MPEETQERYTIDDLEMLAAAHAGDAKFTIAVMFERGGWQAMIGDRAIKVASKVQPLRLAIHDAIQMWEASK